MTPLIECQEIHKDFPIHGGLLSRVIDQVHAINSVSLKINRGETLGLVGESGCGKSTLGRILIRLINPSEGKVLYDGQDITHLESGDLRKLRRKLQIIFQDPYASLNPRMRVRTLIEEPLIVHKIFSSEKDQKDRIKELLEMVGLPRDAAEKFPHEFSGGQRQRIGIARALAVEPEFIVCDEPVSALDVSIQAQIVNLLMDLQQKLGLTYLFIAHDLNVVEHISNRVAVMYLGKVVELAEAEELYLAAKHPYTGALFSASPIANPKIKRERIILQGDPPSPISLPSGCSFHPRCPQAQADCRINLPKLEPVRPSHTVSCWNQLS